MTIDDCRDKQAIVDSNPCDLVCSSSSFSSFTVTLRTKSEIEIEIIRRKSTIVAFLFTHFGTRDILCTDSLMLYNVFSKYNKARFHSDRQIGINKFTRSKSNNTNDRKMKTRKFNSNAFTIFQIHLEQSHCTGICHAGDWDPLEHIWPSNKLGLLSAFS